MKFYIDIDVTGLPTCEYNTSANSDFEKLPADQGDMLLAVNRNYPRVICFRDGRSFQGQHDQKGPGDICTLEFDDFVPGMTLDDNPEWYGLLKDRILAVRAQECYGPGQGIAVSEKEIYGFAVARIRNQPELVYNVKITARGPRALEDARALHLMLLKGR